MKESLSKFVHGTHVVKNIQRVHEDTYWQSTFEVYPWYPTIRHRRRFIISSIKKFLLKKVSSVFDYGVGDGTLLKEIKDRFLLQDNLLGGCDISRLAIDLAKDKFNCPYLYDHSFPVVNLKFDVITCSEVIEHTKDYIKIFEWSWKNLNENGLFILTTQTGKLYASDKYTKHVQHFDISNLNYILKRLGFNIKLSRLWGFPLFSLQKLSTNFNFQLVKNDFLEGKLTFKKKLVFDIAYYLYFLHDLINLGPQIYIVASKE